MKHLATLLLVCFAVLAPWAIVAAGLFIDPLFLYVSGLLGLGCALYVFFTGAMRPDPRPGYHPRYERNDERLPL